MSNIAAHICIKKKKRTYLLIFEYFGDSVLSLLIFLVYLQMTGKDKDYRYMATSDLLNELNKEGFKADADLEIKLSNIVLQQLDDVAGDVSGLAVKWYEFLRDF